MLELHNCEKSQRWEKDKIQPENHPPAWPGCASGALQDCRVRIEPPESQKNCTTVTVCLCGGAYLWKSLFWVFVFTLSPC